MADGRRVAGGEGLRVPFRGAGAEEQALKRHRGAEGVEERVLVEDEGAQPRRRTVRAWGEHGAVISENRVIEVVVRGQMDGIRPIETAVLTYRWHAPSLDARGLPAGDGRGWEFISLASWVQGLDGSLKQGSTIWATDLQQIGPSLGWAWDLVQQHRPRG